MTISKSAAWSFTVLVSCSIRYARSLFVASNISAFLAGPLGDVRIVLLRDLHVSRQVYCCTFTRVGRPHSVSGGTKNTASARIAAMFIARNVRAGDEMRFSGNHFGM